MPSFFRSPAWKSLLAVLALPAPLSGCHNLLLFPVPLIPAQMSGAPELRRISVETPDKESLDAWYAPPAAGKPLILLFHGVKGRERGYESIVDSIRGDGYGVFFAAFRGYPQSTGEPSQDGLYTDGLALFDRAKLLCACQIILVGHSLGSGVAVHTAAFRRARAVLLFSPYSSIQDVAQHRFRMKPIGQEAKNGFPSMQWIGKVTEPLLMLHGAKDETIPIRYARKLYDAANEPKLFKSFSDSGHHLIWETDLLHWLDRLLQLEMPRGQQ